MLTSGEHFSGNADTLEQTEAKSQSSDSFFSIQHLPRCRQSDEEGSLYESLDLDVLFENVP